MKRFGLTDGIAIRTIEDQIQIVSGVKKLTLVDGHPYKSDSSNSWSSQSL